MKSESWRNDAVFTNDALTFLSPDLSCVLVFLTWNSATTAVQLALALITFVCQAQTVWISVYTVLYCTAHSTLSVNRFCIIYWYPHERADVWHEACFKMAKSAHSSVTYRFSAFNVKLQQIYC